VNRANLRAPLFLTHDDYRTFVDVLSETTERFDAPLLGYCVMPNHWHLVVVPASMPELSRAMHWLTSTHTRRWLKVHDRGCPGHVYQSRFYSVPVQPGIHLSRVLRYVERNASAAALAARAEEWRWSSAYQRASGAAGPRLLPQRFLPAREWLEYLNSPVLDRETAHALRMNLPIGDPNWIERLRAESGLPERRPRGRPKKPPLT
jgi:putative transposase